MAPLYFFVGCVLATILAYIFEIHCNEEFDQGLHNTRDEPLCLSSGKGTDQPKDERCLIHLVPGLILPISAWASWTCLGVILSLSCWLKNSAIEENKIQATPIRQATALLGWSEVFAFQDC